MRMGTGGNARSRFIDLSRKGYVRLAEMGVTVSANPW
jgi:hypothetical protein